MLFTLALITCGMRALIQAYSSNDNIAYYVTGNIAGKVTGNVSSNVPGNYTGIATGNVTHKITEVNVSSTKEVTRDDATITGQPVFLTTQQYTRVRTETANPLEGFPDTPAMFEPSSITSQSIIVRWLPRGPGAFVQEFELEVKQLKDKDYRTVDSDIPSSGFEGYVMFTIEELKPDTEYAMRVRAYNDKGFGKYTHTTAKTKVTPVVTLIENSIVMNYKTAYLSIKWTVDAGEPDRLQLLYRKRGTSQVSPLKKDQDPPPLTKDQGFLNGGPGNTWGVLVDDLDPDAGEYSGVTDVKLPTDVYDLMLVAYEGDLAIQPVKVEHATLIVNVPKGSGLAPNVVIALVLTGVLFTLVIIFVSVVVVKIKKRRLDDEWLVDTNFNRMMDMMEQMDNAEST